MKPYWKIVKEKLGKFSEKEIAKVSELDHIIFRPDMYIGSLARKVEAQYVIKKTTDQSLIIMLEKINSSNALYKI